MNMAWYLLELVDSMNVFDLYHSDSLTIFVMYMECYIWFLTIFIIILKFTLSYREMELIEDSQYKTLPLVIYLTTYNMKDGTWLFGLHDKYFNNYYLVF